MTEVLIINGIKVTISYNTLPRPDDLRSACKNYLKEIKK